MELLNEAFKDRVLDLSVSGIYVFDLVKGLNIYINQQYTHLTGYTLDDINGMTQEEFFALFHPDEQALIAQHMQDVIAAEIGDVLEVEYRFKKADGTWMWCLSKDAVFDVGKNKETTQFMGSFIDITDRKKAQRKLEAFNHKLQVKNKELKQFAYVASHDLQEPLRTVNSFVELLLRQYKGQLDEKAEKYLDIISKAAIRMSNLVKALLDYNRIGNQKSPTHVDCNTLINAIQEDLSSKIASTEANFDIGELPKITGYETELRLLFQNLISNAIKFSKTDKTPQIKISAEKKNEQWEFSVQDNGIGIKDEHREKIFMIFQRLHNQDDYEGTGIGLAHCHKIVSLHGGQIWVDSSPNQGSTFYFTIPTE